MVREVFEVFLKENCVIVEDMNMVKKYICLIQDNFGGINEVFVFIYIFNLMLVDFKLGEFICVGRKEENGKLVCYFKKFGEIIK